MHGFPGVVDDVRVAVPPLPEAVPRDAVAVHDRPRAGETLQRPPVHPARGPRPQRPHLLHVRVAPGTGRYLVLRLGQVARLMTFIRDLGYVKSSRM